MLTTKNSGTGPLRFPVLFAAVVLLGGCTPSGPKALLQGERFIHDGKYTAAVERLKIAVQLLPDNGQAWNHLGIALHSNGELKEATRAYREALRRSPNLAVTHFNLGVLSLDQNDPQAAVAALTTYTVLQRESIEGWLKLGTAQLRARQFDPAEKSFQAALRLKPGLPEALNGLGVASAQRRRVRDAVTWFSNALKTEPNYAPALLNLAVVTQPFDAPGALQRYKSYLALDSTSPNASAVRELIQQLENESAVVPPAATNKAAAIAQQLVLTNKGAARASTSGPPTTAQPANVQGRPAVARNLSSPTNFVATGVVAVTRPPGTPLKGAEQLSLAQPTKSNGLTTHVPAPIPNREPPTSPPQEVKLPNDPAPRSPVDFALVSRRALVETPAAPASVDAGADEQKSDGTTADSNRPAAAEEKRSLAQRLNPATWFRPKNKPSPITTPLDPNPRLKPLPPPQAAPPQKEKLVAKSDVKVPTKSSSEPSRSSPTLSPAEGQPAPARISRYEYLSPAKPPTGDRARAEQALARGVLAHNQRQLTAALDAYREAARTDPSLFEAQYNLGLAAYEMKEWPLSLSSYETALSINPTSANARFNFALALDRAGYSLDSAAQLEKLLAENPKEARAHFSVAKIYAEQLQNTDTAARHYQQLLELEPQHPQAAAIRQWLVAHAARQ